MEYSMWITCLLLYISSLFPVSECVKTCDDDSVAPLQQCRALTCQDENLQFGCPDGLFLILKSVFYGRNDPTTCYRSWGINPTTCQHKTALGILIEKCYKKQQCYVNHNNIESQFGNPCPGVPKYFDIEYTCVSDDYVSPICSDAPLQEPHGYITSSNYPEVYPHNMECDITLPAREGQVVEISILDIQLEYLEPLQSCFDQVVFIQEGSDPRARTLCSTSLEEVLNSNGGGGQTTELTWTYDLRQDVNPIRVIFESSSSVEYRGFNFEYKVIGCPKQEIPTPPENGIIYRYDISEKVVYTCLPGYYLDQSVPYILTCEGNTWQGGTGICLPASSNTSTVPSSSSSTSTTTSTTAQTSTSTTTQTSTPTKTHTSTPTTTQTTSLTTITSTTASTATSSTTVTSTTSTPTSTSTSTTTLSTTAKTTPVSTTSSTVTPSPTPTPASTSSTTVATPETTKTTASVASTKGPVIPSTIYPTARPTTPLPFTTTSKPVKTTTRPGEKTTVSKTDAPKTEPPTTPVFTLKTTGILTTTKPASTTSRAQTLVQDAAAFTDGAVTGIAIGSGLLLMVAAVIVALTALRSLRRRRKQQEAKEGIASLRPSRHACVSIPNTYAGVTGIGFAAKANTAVPSQESINEDNGDMTDNSMDTISRSRTSSTKHDPTRGSDPISVNSSLYELPVAPGTNGNNNSKVSVTNYDKPSASDDYLIPRDPFHEDLYSSGSGLIQNEIFDPGLATIDEEPDVKHGSKSTLSYESQKTVQTDDSSIRPRSLENTKGSKHHNGVPKVNYPLFKEDNTGNLDNYLDSRRVSV